MVVVVVVVVTMVELVVVVKERRTSYVVVGDCVEVVKTIKRIIHKISEKGMKI